MGCQLLRVFWLDTRDSVKDQGTNPRVHDCSALPFLKRASLGRTIQKRDEVCLVCPGMGLPAEPGHGKLGLPNIPSILIKSG